MQAVNATILVTLGVVVIVGFLIDVFCCWCDVAVIVYESEDARLNG